MENQEEGIMYKGHGGGVSLAMTSLEDHDFQVGLFTMFLCALTTNGNNTNLRHAVVTTMVVHQGRSQCKCTNSIRDCK